MKLRELLRLLLWPIAGICLLLSAQAFFAHYTQGQSRLLDYLNGIIDLREERTIGTWFESLLFALTGASFFLVSRHPALPKFGKMLLVLMALGFIFLSADEMLSLHEFAGFQLEQASGIVQDTRLQERGYSWVLLYGPLAISVFGLVSGYYCRMTSVSEKRAASIFFLLAWVAVELVVLLEVADGWSILWRKDWTILSCFEEAFELCFLMLFYAANLLIAEEAEL